MTDETNRPYPEVEAQASFPALEEKVLARWRERGTFARSVEARAAGEDGANEFVFYDGPPFANGLPHYGHLLTGYVKDVVPRYQTMRGRRVERRFGWDCHGLPAEMNAEKALGVSGRGAILEYGIDRFNAYCRGAVGEFREEWRHYVERQARWVAFDDDYKTMDLPFMESVLWAFKALYDKGLLYEGFRVMPYSWAAQSPVSNFETRMDNSYRPRQDPAITVLFELVPEPGDGAPTKILAWTTTPWTLPSNLALAVGPEVDYAVLEEDGVRYLIGAAALGKYEKELGTAARVGTVRGAELVGRRYAPLFPYFAGDAEATGDAFRVLGGDFVDTEEGTGVVHMAPGFGEDDQTLCEANGIRVVCPVDDAGRFTSRIEDYQGLLVFDANKPIVKRLKEEGALVRHETYEHSYPHCWRTDEPLIYRALSSWYVKVTAIRDRMVELNQEIEWFPAHVRDGQFGKWLEGARDWSISRNRFWGAPIPVWKSDDPAHPRLDVYGSLDELERDFGVRLDDLHRPGIDALTRPNPDDPSGRSTMRRVEDVLDCWFESGSMPYAQVHYPFENREWFEHHSPADFIVEYVSQTRGWFYTLMVLGTALFDRPPFKAVICHGTVLDEKGLKLSKRLRNYPDPQEIYSTHGADALRWFLMSSTVLRGLDLQVRMDSREVTDAVRLVLNPIWNAYYFFTLYANTDGVRASFRTDQERRLDRYALAKTRALVEGVQASFESNDIPGACGHVRGYLDALNNWWIRRSRDRFWRPMGESADGDADKRDAYDTLYSCLNVLCRVAAPLLPFLSEEVFTGLTGEESVHLTDWPDAAGLPDDPALVEAMDEVRTVCSTVLALREEHRLRIRLPLAELVVAGTGASALEPFLDLVADEVNVRSVTTSDELEAWATFDLKVEARACGPRLGARTKEVIAASKRGEWVLSGGAVEVVGETLEEGEYSLRLVPREGLEGRAVAALPSNGAVVVLDVRTTPELEREGVARDVVRLVQTARRDAGLAVSDRIRLALDGAEAVRAAVEVHRAFVAEQVLAESLEPGGGGEGWHEARGETAGGEVVARLARV